jgi:hypothetical protein
MTQPALYHLHSLQIAGAMGLLLHFARWIHQGRVAFDDKGTANYFHIFSFSFFLFTFITYLNYIRFDIDCT